MTDYANPTQSEVLKRLHKVEDRLSVFANKPISETELSFIASVIADVSIPKAQRRASGRIPDVLRYALYESIGHLLGQAPSLQVLKANIHRLIANWGYIKAGIPVPRWQGEPITSDVEFLSVYTEIKDNKRIWHIRTKLHTGLAAGSILVFALSNGIIDRFLDKISGCGKYLCDTAEISGMRARITHWKEGSRDKIQTWNASQQHKKHNVQLSEKRCDMAKCKRLIACHTCKMTVAECPLAVWAKTNGEI